MRTSSYTIYVELPESQSEMLLVHGYSGAYDKISKKVAAYLRGLEAGPTPPPLYGEWGDEPELAGYDGTPPSEATVARLRKRGYLTDKTVEEEEEFFAGLAKKHHSYMLRGRLAYIVMPTYDCNLRCSYCFQDHMRTKPEFSHLLKSMGPTMADRMISAWEQIEERHQVAEGFRRDITFFGGEPLLAVNRANIEHILTKTQSLGPARFGAVTNATELESYRELLHPEAISWLQVTLDGPPEEHDQRRVYADGSGSFARIERNVQMALEREVSVAIRLNIDRNNIGQLPELADYLVAQGWADYKGFSVYTAPIHAANAHTDLETTMSSWQLDQALDELREVHPNMAVIARPDDGMQARVQRLFGEETDPIAIFKSSFCGAHTGMYVFDPLGDIYSCWEKTGNPAIRVASIAPDGSLDWVEKTQKMWRSRTVASNPTCRKCRYALHCGGGCAALAMSHRDEFFTNFCDGFQARFRHAVSEAYQGHESGAAAARTQESVCGV